MTAVAPSRDDVFLSIAVITKNESDRIHHLLEGADIADEVVVVDSGSIDRTVHICRGAGAKVIHREWQGYAAQKQYAMEQCRGAWVLNLDADEALSREAKNEILLALRDVPDEVAGFSMPRLSRYLNTWIRHGGWYPDRKVRLVRRDRARWVGDGIHERLEVRGHIRKLNHPILHHVYRDIADQVKTINTFSTVTAEHRRRARSGRYVWLGVLHAFGKFLECAVWKLGLLDGIPGLIIAVNSSFYVFLKHAKTWEKGLYKQERTSRDVSQESDDFSGAGAKQGK